MDFPELFDPELKHKEIHYVKRWVDKCISAPKDRWMNVAVDMRTFSEVYVMKTAIKSVSAKRDKGRVRGRSGGVMQLGIHGAEDERQRNDHNSQQNEWCLIPLHCEPHQIESD